MNQFVEYEGREQWVQMNYLRTGLEYIGKVKADGKTPIGNYHYFHPNGLPSINLQFDNNGKATGTWEFFNEYDQLTKRWYSRKMKMKKSKRFTIHLVNWHWNMFK